MTETIVLLLWFVCIYFWGSIPVGKIVVWLLKQTDIQSIGSGNIGATNVSRLLGRKWGISVFVLDFAKGFFPVIISSYFWADLNIILLSGLIAVLGHIFSVFLKFKGGKGVATTAGVFFAFYPLIVIIVACFQLIILKLYKIMSVATFTALFVLNAFMLALAPLNVIYFSLVITILILFTHRQNIKRLIQGDELTYNNLPK